MKYLVARTDFYLPRASGPELSDSLTIGALVDLVLSIITEHILFILTEKCQISSI